MRCHDDPDIQFYILAAANPYHFLFLQHPEQLRLHIQVHIADLVEKNGAVVGLFKAADAAVVGARKRTLFMAEHLAFDQLFGDGRHVYRHKRLFPADRRMMYRFGNQFFTGTGFSVNGNRDVGARRLFYQDKHLVDGRTVALDQVVDLVLAADLFFQDGNLLAQLNIFAYVLDDVPHALLGILILQDVIVGAFFQQLDGGCHILLPRNDHHRGVGIELLDLLEHLQPGHIGQVIVERDQRGILVEVFQQAFAVRENLYLIVRIQRKMVRNNLRENNIVLNDKYPEGV